MIGFTIEDAGLKYVEEFEKKFAKFLGVKYCVAVSSGTIADTIALAVLKNLYPKKKKVIVPRLTFIAQINSILYNGLKPVYEETSPKIDKDTLCYFPVHLLGRPTLIPKLNIPIIEDACEALGSKLNNRFCGTVGDMGTFSFFVTHTFSTGEGGAIVTNNKKYSDLARILRTHGERPGEKFVFDYVGFNGKMAGIIAQKALKKLKTLKQSLKKRHDNFIKMGGTENKGEYIVPHGFPVYNKNKKKKIKELKSRGIDARPLFNAKNWLYVPCHQNLSDREVEYIKRNL